MGSKLVTPPKTFKRRNLFSVLKKLKRKANRHLSQASPKVVNRYIVELEKIRDNL